MILGPVIKGVIAGSSAAVGMGMLNRRNVAQSHPPATALDGESCGYYWRHGRVLYQVAGPKEAPPLVLVHGIYATASNWEMRAVHKYFAEKYRVYTPDLLGFGLSDHPAIYYDDNLYIEFLTDFVAEVVGSRTAVIASSLGATYTVSAAARRPDLFGPLVLIEPVGIHQRSCEAGILGKLSNAILRSQVLGEFLFNLLVSKPGLRWFLKSQVFLDSARVTDDLVQIQYDLGHQPNARFAPAAFISGTLNRNIRDEFAGLEGPVLLIWGYQATMTPIQQATFFLQANPRAEIVGFDAKALPHVEAAEDFNEEVESWLRRTWPPIS